MNRDWNPNFEDGYFKLWRAFFDHEIWKTKPEAWGRVALICMAKANYRSSTWWDGKESVTIPPGSFVASLEKLGDSARASREQVRKSLRYLQETQFLTQIRTSPYRLISITNWPVYQGGQSDGNTPGNTSQNTPENTPRTPLEHLKNTVETPSKECKKERREEERQECAFDTLDFGEPEEAKNGWKSDFFEKSFWPKVWMKRGKGEADRAFRKAATGQGRAEYLLERAIEQGPLIMADAKKRKSTPLHVSTWLNGRRYEDDWGEAEDTGEDLY